MKRRNRNVKKRETTRTWRVYVPIKPYLKKYVTHFYGDALRLDNSTALSRMAFSLLEKKVIRDQRYSPKGLAGHTVGQTEVLTMIVTERTFTHVGHSISPEKAAYLNAFIKNQFDFSLTMAVTNLHCRKGMQIKTAIEEYCKTIGIETEIDISMDNLLKIWHRTIKTLEPKKKNPVTGNIITPFQTSEQLELF